MEVDQGAKAIIVNVGQTVVLEVEDLKIVLLGQDPGLQLGEAVVAQVEGDQLAEVSEDVVREQVAGHLIVRNVEQQ